MNRRGVKLKFPGSWKEKRTKLKTKYVPKYISEGLENSCKTQNNQRISTSELGGREGLLNHNCKRSNQKRFMH